MRDKRDWYLEVSLRPFGWRLLWFWGGGSGGAQVGPLKVFISWPINLQIPH